MGVYEQFKFNVSPLEITVVGTGQKIHFRGIADNEEEGEFINYEDDLTLAMTISYKINGFLDNTDKIRYEKMKEDNPERYKVEGLGLWRIIEGLIFHEARHWIVEKFDQDQKDVVIARVLGTQLQEEAPAYDPDLEIDSATGNRITFFIKYINHIFILILF